MPLVSLSYLDAGLKRKNKNWQTPVREEFIVTIHVK